MRKIILIILGSIFVILFCLFLIRLVSPREIDDVSPGIFCEEDYLKKLDILWVIPNFQGESISKNSEWCEYILSLNKTLGLHGVTHKYEEFMTERNQEYLNEGIEIFEDCFGFKPTMFKPPQLAISEENKKLISENNIELKGRLNQFFHKVYHCNDTGEFSNKFIDLF